MKYSTIYHISSKLLRIDCLQDGFVVYNSKVILRKIEVISDIPDSMIPDDFCQKNHLSLIIQLIT